MKTIGIVRRTDKLGRIVIPKEIRSTFKIKEGDPVEIFTDKDKIILKKYKLMEESNNNESILKKKIEEKIKELEKEKDCNYSGYKIEELNYKIQVLKKLLEEE